MKYDSMRKGMTAALLAVACCTAAGERPLMMIRLRQIADDRQWAETFDILRTNRGACDEVWFPTSVGFPRLEWHEAHVGRLLRYAGQLRSAGIVPSIGFQATLGHSDALTELEGTDGKSWGGFTGRGGGECRYVSCPRQPAFVAYMRKVARLYASIKPGSFWLNDDLRINNHTPGSPRTDGWIGCWCRTCIAAFSAETQGKWTRETLDAAMAADATLFDRWERFSFDGIAALARAIAEEVHSVSPETRLAYQHGPWRNDAQLAVFRAMHEATGLPVGSRPGGSGYHDFNPNWQMHKAFRAARQRRTLGDPAWIDTWCPEIESYPRAFASRTAQSIIDEAFVNLALGMNTLSFLVMDVRVEPAEWYGKAILGPLAAERPLFDACSRHNADAVPAGFVDASATARETLYLEPLYDVALAGIPLLPGPGKAYGSVDDGDLASFRLCNMSSSALLELRHRLDARTGGRLPVVVETPSVGLVLPQVTHDGTLRSVAMLNTRIDLQPPTLLRLRGVPPGKRTFTWWALRCRPEELSAVRDGCDALVTVPAIAAWSGGCLFVDMADGARP